MSKSLRSMAEPDRARAVSRRLRENKGGNGYWAARDCDGTGGGPVPIVPEIEEPVIYALDPEDGRNDRGRLRRTRRGVRKMVEESDG